MATRAGLCLILILVTSPLAFERGSELIVWNVGQGQWVTLALDGACWHFDVGGEFAPLAAVRARCGSSTNQIIFSHWDLDHVGFASKVHSTLPNACVLASPLGAASARKRRLLAKLPACLGRTPFATWSDPRAREANAGGRVSLYQGTLIPGDAPRAQERKFVAAFKKLAEARWLVLGHHGSRTSTSNELMAALPRLKAAIASARARRYGHPHAETRATLRAFRVPLILTEDWGHVHAWL